MTSPQASESLESLLFLAEAGGAVPEADLHGQRWDEARSAAEALLQRAFVRGERVLRVIHGKGDGRLRDALHRWRASERLGDRSVPTTQSEHVRCLAMI